jgi:hypothetical protein
MSCFSMCCDADTRSLAHLGNNHQNNAEHSQYECKDLSYKKRNHPYPFPSDPTEIDR